MANDVEVCSNLNVDCEYNRRLNEPKSIFDADSSLEVARRFFPDIIIHKRGYNDQNFLACEIKLVGQRGKEADRVRLKRLTSDSGQYQYKLGAFIVIDQLMNVIRVEFFENGKYLPEQLVILNA